MQTARNLKFKSIIWNQDLKNLLSESSEMRLKEAGEGAAQISV